MQAEEPSADAAPDLDDRGPEEANPKRLIVFCDGTWNDLRGPHLTNVARLAKCVHPTGMMDLGGGRKVKAPQVVYYDEGVGVGEGVSKVTDWLVRKLGGGLGGGLDAKIEKAYRFIVLNYNPRDEIFVFGFSRGAYTARSLCGLIRKCGVLRRTEFERTPEALDLYRSEVKPSHADAQNFRRQYSHPVIAGPEDYTDAQREAISLFKESIDVNKEVPVIPPDIRRQGFHIKYLGVWDTVGSLGVPDNYKPLFGSTPNQFKFHDTKASSLIENLRHAVSLDEERRVFDVTPVENIHELNILWAAACQQAQVDFPHADHYVPYDKRPYQQRWFPGGHGAVGGGSIELGLSSAALLWVAEGAERAGLTLDYSPANEGLLGDDRAGLKLDHSPGSELAEAERLAQPCANWKINKDGTPRLPGDKDPLGEVGGYRRRGGPPTIDEIHESARERWRRDSTYRPSGMMRFENMPQLKPIGEPPPIAGTTKQPGAPT